ncbi:inactive dipeptidyl peptidase 10 [Anabrus simplex]|uniref:inactive dipeptidyl peptidase 10 n=1 Tax=Anabrus simplex TaxID=316456 RepID=UPI0035A2EA61
MTPKKEVEQIKEEKKKDEEDEEQSQEDDQQQDQLSTTSSSQPPPQLPHAPALKRPQQSQAKRTSIKRVVTILPGKEELVASTPSQRNWRGILIALLVIVAVLGLIVFSIVLLSPPDEGPRVKGKKFTLDDILGTHFHPPRFNGTWVSETELVYRDIYEGISIFNADNQTSRVLVSNSTFRQLNAVEFKISSDLNFVLLISDIKKTFKYSFEARYYIYEVDTGHTTELTPPMDDDTSHPLLQLAVWSTRGNALAFVYRNNIYYRPRANEKTVYQVTHKGQPGVIFYGVPDWLYEEEILHSPSAMWFSPDGKILLFASFNDSLVGELRYPWYGSLQQRLKYPQMRSLRYPKAGTRNPVATLWTVELSQPQALHLMDVKPPLEVRNPQSVGDHYFTAVTWAPNQQVAVVWMNRRQNVSVISLCRGSVWTCENTHIQRATERGWVDIYQPPLFSADGQSFMARLPVRDAENGYFKHVCHVDVETHRVTPLTTGAFEVTNIILWDEENHYVYFLAAPERKPGQRHLYRVGDVNSTLASKSWECLTCPQMDPSHHGSSNSLSSKNSPENGTEMAPHCLFTWPHFSPGPSPRFCLLECLGPNTPTISLVDIKMRLITILDAYTALKERWEGMATPQVKTFQVELKDGYHAQVRLHLPPGLREYEEMIFPLVLHVSGAPGSQLVSERWLVDWNTYLSSHRNFIVAQIDGRGSGFQGDRLTHELYHRLGSVEIEDQIAVITYLKDNVKFVDKDHIGVWGWSYGGFAAAMILAQDKEVFRCGISVAPVTNWAHYDSAYAERYMGTPNVTDNYRGYEESDVTKRAGNLRDKLFLLIHGTADDTVHYQQSMMLVKALTDEGVLFRHQTYPDEGHTFSGVQDHFYKAMESFFDDCFGPIDFEEWEVGTSFFSFKQ